MSKFTIKVLRGAPLKHPNVALKLSVDRIEEAQRRRRAEIEGTDRAQVPESGGSSSPESTQGPVDRSPDAISGDPPSPAEDVPASSLFRVAADTANTADGERPTLGSGSHLGAGHPPKPPPIAAPVAPVPVAPDRAIPVARTPEPTVAEPPPSTSAPAQPAAAAASPARSSPVTASPVTESFVTPRDPKAPLPESRRIVESDRQGLVVPMVASALLAATVTAIVLTSPGVGRDDGVSKAELERSRLDALEELRILDHERADLERRATIVLEDEERILKEWEALQGIANRLEEEHTDAIDGSEAFARRLGRLIDRSRTLAGDGSPLPPELKAEAERLGQEASGYQRILIRELDDLDDRREIAREQAATVVRRLQTRDLRGRAIRVIHDPKRTADATEAVRLLVEVGADAYLFAAELADPSAHKGRLYYHGEDEERVARQLAELIDDIEPMVAEPVGLSTPFMSLWIVGEPPLGAELETDVEAIPVDP